MMAAGTGGGGGGGQQPQLQMSNETLQDGSATTDNFSPNGLTP